MKQVFKIISCFVLLIAYLISHAQTSVVSGTIKDQNGETMPGVAIIVNVCSGDVISDLE